MGVSVETSPTKLRRSSEAEGSDGGDMSPCRSPAGSVRGAERKRDKPAKAKAEEGTVAAATEPESLAEEDLATLLQRLTAQKAALHRLRSKEDAIRASAARREAQKRAGKGSFVPGGEPWRRPSAATHEFLPSGCLPTMYLSAKETQLAIRPTRTYEMHFDPPFLDPSSVSRPFGEPMQKLPLATTATSILAPRSTTPRPPEPDAAKLPLSARFDGVKATFSAPTWNTIPHPPTAREFESVRYLNERPSGLGGTTTTARSGAKTAR